MLLCDDKDARRAAVKRTLRVTGTLGIIELAAMRGLVDLPTCVEELWKTTIRMPEGTLKKMLQNDAAWKLTRGKS